MFGEWPGEVAPCEDPFMAARCDEDNTALSAAFAGSNACSIIDLSWTFCWRCVGEAFFGVDPKNSFLVENFLANPPDWLRDGVATGGDIVFEVS